MWFSKRSPPKLQKPETLEPEWEQPGAASQRVRVQIGQFTYVQWPTVLPENRHHTPLAWEGIIRGSARSGLRASGDIAVRPDAATSRISTDWKDSPRSLHGMARAAVEDFGVATPRFLLSVVLTCRPEEFADVRQTFAVAVGSPRSWLNLDIILTHPDLGDAEHDYWRSRWRKDVLQVAGWELASGATRPDHSAD